MLLMVLMAMGASVKAFASARVDAMGADIREVDDIDLIWLYPNMVTQYKNTVDFRLNANQWPGEFGDGTGEWGGVIAEESSLGGVLGVYVNRPYELYNTSGHSTIDSINIQNPLRYYWTNVADVKDTYNVPNIFDAFWGQGIGGADLGVHLNYGDTGVGNGDSTVSPAEADKVGLAVGLGFTGAGPFDSLNVHVDYDTESITDVNNDSSKNKDNGVYDVKLGALGQVNVSTDNFIKVFADASINQEDLKDLQGFNVNATTFDLGASCSHKVNGGKGLVLTGLILNYLGGQRTVYETSPTPNEVDSQNEWDLVWNASLESELASWLTARFGLYAPIVSRAYVFGDTPSYFSNVDNNVCFSSGFGINWQNFTLDAMINVESLENSIASVEPGNGLFFAGANGNAENGEIIAVEEADLHYKF